MASGNRVAKTFCTTREAAQILGVSLRTAQLWSESGLLEAWKTEGGHRRISRQSVERLLANPTVRISSAIAVDQEMAREEVGQARPFTILVVEDEPDLRRVYEIVMSRWALRPRVIAMPEGYEALIRLGLEKPDLVITDLLMPGMDGFRMIESIRTVPEMIDTTIVVVTGMDPNDIEDRGGLPAGIRILPKPIPFEQLREIAETVVAHRVTQPVSQLSQPA